jgi:hypothetical protein
VIEDTTAHGRQSFLCVSTVTIKQLKDYVEFPSKNNVIFNSTLPKVEKYTKTLKKEYFPT